MFQQGYYLRPVCHKYSFIFIPGPSAPPPPYSPEPPGFKREYTQGTICTFEEAYHVLQIILQILIINECSLWSCVPAKYCASADNSLAEFSLNIITDKNVVNLDQKLQPNFRPNRIGES